MDEDNLLLRTKLLQHLCPVSSSGTCIGQQIRSDRGRAPGHKESAYAQPELHLLQMTDRIALHGSKAMQGALRVVLESFIERMDA